MVAGKDRPYILVPYRPEWLQIFERLKELLKEVLEDQVVKVYHFGSTSIPNITLAKPQVDVIVECRDLEKLRLEWSDVLEKLLWVKRHQDGYTSALNEIYCTQDDEFSGMRQVSLHIMETGDPEIQKPLIFRNYLIHNPDALADYVALKKRLYRKYPNSYRNYDREKGEFIKNVLLPKALVWHEVWSKTSAIIKTLSPRF